MDVKTHLVKKVARDSKVCTSCDQNILEGNIYHREEGINQHIHSLLARHFCSDCYAKYGEKKLLEGNE